MLRMLKILLVLFIGLHALIYAVQNIANLGPAHAALGYVLSNQGHEVYPDSMFFSVTQVGTGSMQGAFMYSMASAITMMFVYSTAD
ncbi:hypothetical protein [Bowmanella yangjiangensis]|uniref:Uncharacterized protein n=1 Tax=Bowmanella yangjiangensis TaxID=2811230 RepID=A0ABS3CQ29_9ALTE|nr:hypothetical protein [Bowmanella yangjiangensis]MBN7819213.1 hypothetical protein [Bowmanella yangjiangensis]